MSKLANIVATLNKQPVGPTRAWVTVDVQVPNSGATASLVKRTPQGIDPGVLLLDVAVHQSPGVHLQVLTWRHGVRFDENPAQEEYTDVTVAYGGEELSQSFEVVH